MANQELDNKMYSVPPEVLKGIQVAKVSSPNGNGFKRANFILGNGAMNYKALVRLKHDFDTNNFADKNQYALAGGDAMKRFIETTLAQDRNAVDRSKEAKQMYGVDPMLGTKPAQIPRLNEEKKDLKKNACAVIVDEDNKILLLKRGNKAPWMPSKWSLVGGAIEKGESAEEAVKREIKEEINLDINKFTKSFTIQRNPDSIETIFACRYKGDPTDIKLNEEHTNYGWYDVDEMTYLEIVPNLLEYISLVFTKYD